MRFPALLRFGLIPLLGVLAHASILRGEEHPLIPIWPEGVPGLRADAKADILTPGWATSVHHPSLTVFKPAKPNGTALIVCPGGAYTHLSIENEGRLIAERFNTAGVTVFVLRYRLLEYGHPAPLRDVLRAVRLVRSRHAEFGIRPNRIGVLGSSAGGHLAACSGTLFDDPAGKTGAELDHVSARPDFVVLLYPVITLQDEPYVHKGSRLSLLGASPTPEQLALLSPDLQVTKDTPPTLLFHAGDDASVPVENSLRFYAALKRAGVPAELHVWPKGGHGFGMRTDVGEAATWPDLAERWMRASGWLPQPTRSSSP